MQIIKIISLLAFCFLLGACTHTPIEHNDKSAKPKSVCQADCLQRFKACTSSCENNCKQCNLVATRSTVKSYHTYKKRQCVRGAMIARELQSYRDPLQCRKTTCNCNADYKVCLQSCTGVIHKRLQVAPHCC